MSIIFSSLSGAKRRIIFITTVVTLSLFAGMVGSYFASSFGFVIFGLGTVNEITPDYNAGASVIIREAKNVVVMQNEQVHQTAKAYQENSLVIAKKIGKLQGGVDKFYNISKPFAEAMPLTSDGWLVTNLRGKFKKEVFKPTDYVLLDKNKNQFNIDRVIKDDKIGLYYLHIKTSDLKVYKNNDTAYDAIGSLVLASNHEGAVLTANVTNIAGNDSVDFSDKIDKQLLLDEKIDQNFSAILSLSNELMGYVNQDGQVIHASTLRLSMDSILKFGAIKRPSLGLYCQNLDRLVPVDGKITDENGCIISNGKDIAVVQGGSAEKSGIKSGDVITSINQESIAHGLSDIVSRFLPGDKITLTVNRDGKQLIIEVTLSERL